MIFRLTKRLKDYTCGVIGVIAILSGANWFCHARTHYDGPRFESMGFA